MVGRIYIRYAVPWGRTQHLWLAFTFVFAELSTARSYANSLTPKWLVLFNCRSSPMASLRLLFSDYVG